MHFYTYHPRPPTPHLHTTPATKNAPINQRTPHLRQLPLTLFRLLLETCRKTLGELGRDLGAYLCGELFFDLGAGGLARVRAWSAGQGNRDSGEGRTNGTVRIEERKGGGWRARGKRTERRAEGEPREEESECEGK